MAVKICLNYIIVTLLIVLVSFGLHSCSTEEILDKNQEKEIILPKLVSFSLSSEKNKLNLIEDVQGEIVKDSIVECWIPYILNDKCFIADIKADGEVLLNDVKITDSQPFDYSKPVNLKVISGEESKDYTVYVHIFTGLPIMWLETENRVDITSKEEYVNAHMKLCEGVVTRGVGDVVEADLQIKGRGNSTWNMPKKPYRLKFNDKISLLGEEKDKSWVLLANYFDKTMLRNATALYMGQLSNLEWTSSSHFVELMLNGRYHGTYQLVEKIKVSKHRVNVGEDGFILEEDNNLNPGEVSFTTKHTSHPIRIHEPEVTAGDDNYEFISNFVNKAEEALFSESFLDEENGYQNYFDIESIVEWYLVNEICENSTSSGNWYMNIMKGEKLKMGPLWDFDLAICNNQWSDLPMDPCKFYTKEYSPWIAQMFKDPKFVNLVKERFAFFYNNKERIFYNIDENAHYLRYSAEENNYKWNNLYDIVQSSSPKSFNIWGCYYSEVQFMKEWLFKRFEWLKSEYEKMPD